MLLSAENIHGQLAGLGYTNAVVVDCWRGTPDLFVRVFQGHQAVYYEESLQMIFDQVAITLQDDPGATLVILHSPLDDSGVVAQEEPELQVCLRALVDNPKINPLLTGDVDRWVIMRIDHGAIRSEVPNLNCEGG